MKKILVIGNGGREHAICDALSRSPQSPEIYNFGMGVNPGIASLCKGGIVGDIMNLDEIQEVGQKVQPDFAIVGPDDPIGIGAVDTLREVGIESFAPVKACAQLESSKSFARNLLKKYNIDASPGFEVFTDTSQKDQRKSFYDQYDGQIVVKADGLMGGKGVLVAGDHFQEFETAEEFSVAAIEKFGKVVFEEKIEGEEFSLISLVDGEKVLDTPAIQDHKRAFENDTGPNTGGMGCVSDEHNSLPFLTSGDLIRAHEITAQTMKAVASETGERYVGVMYGGFMVTKDGVKLIEYNSRFGDPEALNILPILKTDFVDVCEKAIEGKLSEIASLEFEPVATVVKYLCPEGYPTDSVKDVEIFDSRESEEKGDGNVFFASVAEKNGKLLLGGSRAVGILGKGENIREANKNCEEMIDAFEGPLFYRSDIGTEELMEKRIEHMREIRGKAEGFMI